MKMGWAEVLKLNQSKGGLDFLVIRTPNSDIILCIIGLQLLLNTIFFSWQHGVILEMF